MNRQNQILAGVLVLQIVLAAVMFWPRPAASVASGEKLFPGLEASHITRLKIKDVAGTQIELAKGAAGWGLAGADDFPAQESVVTPFLDKLAGLKADRMVTRTGSSHKRLKVAISDFERMITIETDDGKSVKFYLGSSPSYQVAHVRPEDRNEVYLVSGLSAADASVQAAGWIDSLYLSLDQNQVTALTVQNKSGLFEFAKDEAGAWTMQGLAEDETLDDSRITTLLSRLATLRMSRPLGKNEQDAYGMKEPAAIVTVQTRDSAGAAKSYTLRVGARDEVDSTYTAISSESEYYVRVASYSVQDFVEQGHDYFLKLPPTPTPAQ
ncbi:MAG: DUF4340 domain-containing protein [Thermoflexales bacterium]|nr:DUF4340 domain-containing protein [Thermoflexales bacterium]